MNYTLNQLRIFHKVSQTLSISKAAEELHLSQPAVSIQLRNFQDQFEIPLIELVRKRIFLTDFGREIAESAEQILAQVYAINYRMHTHKGGLTGRLRIAVVSSGKYIAPYYVSGFVSRHEGVDLLLDVNNRTQVLRQLENNEVDFAFVATTRALHRTAVLVDQCTVDAETRQFEGGGASGETGADNGNCFGLSHVGVGSTSCNIRANTVSGRVSDWRTGQSALKRALADGVHGSEIRLGLRVKTNREGEKPSARRWIVGGGNDDTTCGAGKACR